MTVALLRIDTLCDHFGNLEDLSCSQLYRIVELGKEKKLVLHHQDEAEYEEKPFNPRSALRRHINISGTYHDRLSL